MYALRRLCHLCHMYTERADGMDAIDRITDQLCANQRKVLLLLAFQNGMSALVTHWLDTYHKLLQSTVRKRGIKHLRHIFYTQPLHQNELRGIANLYPETAKKILDLTKKDNWEVMPYMSIPYGNRCATSLASLPPNEGILAYIMDYRHYRPLYGSTITAFFKSKWYSFIREQAPSLFLELAMELRYSSENRFYKTETLWASDLIWMVKYATVHSPMDYIKPIFNEQMLGSFNPWDPVLFEGEIPIVLAVKHRRYAVVDILVGNTHFSEKYMLLINTVLHDESHPLYRYPLDMVREMISKAFP